MLEPMQPKTPREQLIREEFARVGGGMTTQAFARHCLDLGLWGEDEQERFVVSHAQGEIRKALTRPDHLGLRFAGPTTKSEDGAPVWQTRRLWGFEDYALNVGVLVSQRNALHEEAVMLAEECRRRFGRVPGTDWPGESAAAD